MRRRSIASLSGLMSLVFLSCVSPMQATLTESQHSAESDATASVPLLLDEPQRPAERDVAPKLQESEVSMPRDVIIKVKPEVFQFESRSSRLTLKSRILAYKFGSAIGPLSGLWTSLEIAGHSDGNSSYPKRNQRLSEERAEAVKLILMSKGVYGRTTVAKGYGSSQPLPGIDPMSRENRRVEFYFKEVKDPEKLLAAVADFIPEK